MLRPRGVLLIADFRGTEAASAGADGSARVAADVRLREQFVEAGFRTLEEEDITANVKIMYRAFADGGLAYRRFALQRT